MNRAPLADLRIGARTAALAGGLLLTLAGAPAPAGGAACTHEACAVTPNGVVELVPDADHAAASKLLLDGEAMKTFAHGAQLRAAHPDRSRAELLLLEIAGEKACLMYRVLEVPAAGELRLGPEFGNCRAIVAAPDLERFGLARSIAFENGEWRFALPAPQSRAARMQIEWYVWANGKVHVDRVVAGRAPLTEADALARLEAEVPERAAREALIRQYGSAIDAYRNLLLRQGLELDPRPARRQR